MITLAANDTIQGIAGTTTAITYSIFGMELATTETYKRLAQGQVATSAGVLYTVPSTTTAFVKLIVLTNTTSSVVSGIKLFIGGTAATNQITGSISIPANGTATFDDNGLHFTDSSGNLSVTEASLDGCVSSSNLKVIPGQATQTLSVWNSSTAFNATQLLVSTQGPQAIAFQFNQTSTLTVGAITIQVTFDGTNWVAPTVGSLIDPTTFQTVGSIYTLQASTNKAFVLVMNGAQQARIVLSTQITGTATVTPFVTYLNYIPGVPTLAGATIGTAGTSYPMLVGNRVFNTAFNTATSSVIITGAPGYYVTGIFLSVDPKSFITGAAQTLGITFIDSVSGLILSFYVFVPGAAPTLSQASAITFTTPPGFFWNNKSSNSTLQFSMGTLSGGNIVVNVNYGICSFVG